jgi:hypothetical protein
MLERHDRGRLDSHRNLAARLGSDLGYSALAPLEPWLGSLSFGGIEPCGDLRMAVASDATMRLARAANDASVSSRQRPLTPVRREQRASR